MPAVAFPLVGLTGFVEFAALLWWGVELWRTMNIVKTSRQAVDCTISNRCEIGCACTLASWLSASLR